MLSSLGTSVPSPRTCTTIGPRLTVSGQTVLASTPGAAGFRRYTAAAAAATTTRPIAPIAICRRSFFFLISGRAISIDWRYCNYHAILESALTHLYSIGYCHRIGVIRAAYWPFPEPRVRFRTIPDELVF